MNSAALHETPRSDAHVAVSTALSLHSAGNVASTGTILRAVRKLSPFCQESDEELIALIVSIATGRTLGVSFDHHDDVSRSQG